MRISDIIGTILIGITIIGISQIEIINRILLLVFELSKIAAKIIFTLISYIALMITGVTITVMCIITIKMMLDSIKNWIKS